jgi:hypothetical protein
VSIDVNATDSAEVGLIGTGGAVGVCCAATAGLGSVVVFVVVLFAALFVFAGFGVVTVVLGLMRFGNTFGATAAQSHRKAIDTTTAMKIRSGCIS